MSPEFRVESEPKIAEVSADFDAYAGENVARFNGLSASLTEGLVLIETVESTNMALADAGRPDLAMVERLEMGVVEEPGEVVDRVSNFAANFNIPGDIEDIRALVSLPKIKSFEQRKELEDSDRFSALQGSTFTHAGTPSFIRMLALYPDFTVDLVRKISTVNHSGELYRYEAELFVAYQLMSRLTDTNDHKKVNQPYTKNADGTSGPMFAPS